MVGDLNRWMQVIGHDGLSGRKLCRGWFCEELATNITDTVMRTADLSVGTESAHRSSISGSPSEPLFMSVQRFARSQDRSCA